jgi:hypothetical protein
MANMCRGAGRLPMGNAPVTAWYDSVGFTNTFTATEIQSLCSSIGATFVSP